MKKNEENKKSRLWFYIITALIPILFFVILELLLRLFNYGTDYTTFVKISDQFEDYLFFNPQLPQKYFSDDVPVPSVIPDGFKKVKPENGIRIFVLGESSAAGFPYPVNASFSRFAQRKLELLFPDNQVEVINLGVSAINTYTIRDIIDDVFEQKPDLILIYTGHNEYYGAMGIGSTQSMGSSPFLVNFILQLKEYKTVQLLSDMINGIAGWFSSKNKMTDTGKTLMGSMIKESNIGYGTDEYTKGLDQFESNMRDILLTCSENKVPVLLSTLASNLMQSPLSKGNGNKAAMEYFEQATNYLNSGKIDEAKKMFIQARDYDVLRFRAPSETNEIIKKLSREFGYTIAAIDSVFDEVSENHIAGYNLMVDHLHPNIEGYKMIGDLLVQKIIEEKLLPVEDYPDSNKIKFADVLLRQAFPFTRMDSSYSKYTIDILLNTFPFKNESNPLMILQIEVQTNYADSLAIKVVQREISWENAHFQLAEYFFGKADYNAYFNEMNALIEDKPFEQYNYRLAVGKLIQAKQYELAQRFLFRNLKRYPDGFTYKSIGIIFSETNNLSGAIEFLENAKRLFPSDAEIYFRLSRAYFFIGNKDKAFE
ncbi:MAG: hypothetical protein V1720_22075, partial [bacterium]